MTRDMSIVKPQEEDKAASFALLALANIASDTHIKHQQHEKRVLQALQPARPRTAAPLMCKQPADRLALVASATLGQAVGVRDFWGLGRAAGHPAVPLAPLPAQPAAPLRVALPSALPAATTPQAARGAKRARDEPAGAAGGAKRCVWKVPPMVLQKQGMTMAADGSARFHTPATLTRPAPASAPAAPSPGAKRCVWKGPTVLQQSPRPVAAGAESSPRSVVVAAF